MFITLDLVIMAQALNKKIMQEGEAWGLCADSRQFPRRIQTLESKNEHCR